MRPIQGRVYRRKGRDGWWVRVRRNGREWTRYGGGKKSEALEELDALKAEIRHQELYGEPITEEISFKDWVKEYFAQIEETHSPGTVVDYRSKSKRFLKAFGSQLVETIRTRDVERFLATLRGVKPATRNRYRAALSSIFKAAVSQGYARENPVAGVKTQREERRPVPYLEYEEQNQLVATCPSTLRPFVRLAMETGMRRGELFRLEWKDVDLARAVITVRISKSKKPREVPITPGAVEVLAELRARRTVPLEGPDRVLAGATTLRRQN